MDEKKTFKERFNEVQNEAKWKLHCLAEWCTNNKETLIIFGPVFVGSIVEIVKIVTRSHTVSEEKALKERYIYDRSTGHYYELKRKPKNSEWLKIEERKQNGESLGMILNDMRLLK